MTLFLCTSTVRGVEEAEQSASFRACCVKDCSALVVAKSLCQKHYKRIKRHGHTEVTRASDWGSREKHPLYPTWQWLRRARGKRVSREWHNDFWAMVRAVGERPTPQARLIAKDPTKPLGPDNWLWERPYLGLSGINGDRRAYEAKAQKAYRQKRPMNVRDTHLYKNYGIRLDDYERMFESQGGVCAICRKPETTVIRGRVIALAVDHCHSSGKIRGLLCVNCNKVIGHAKDSLETLERSIEYLKATLPLASR